MAKQREVEERFHGYHKGEDYNRAMEKARAEDQASYGSVPVQRNAAVDSCFDDCHAKLMGCCGHDEDNPENNSCCTIM